MPLDLSPAAACGTAALQSCTGKVKQPRGWQRFADVVLSHAACFGFIYSAEFCAQRHLQFHSQGRLDCFSRVY